MTIYVNDQPALLKAGSSFDYISENRLFLGRDGYSLTLTFPLKDCPLNRAIFGHLERLDVAKSKLLYECSIIDKGVSLYGTLQITGVDNKSVKAQFSEGRCEQTVKGSLDDIYINQLDLGEWPEELPSAPVLNGSAEEVTYPWINSAYPDSIQNLMTSSDGVSWGWHPDTKECSWQIRLIVLTKRICEALGYETEFNAWMTSPLKYLIVCNTLPSSWDIRQYARALPAWSVSEYFEKLELFLLGEFEFDHQSKIVKFAFSKSIINNLPEIELKSVVDSYDSEILKNDDSSCNYIGTRNLTYKNTGHQLSNYYSCDWLMQKWPENGIIQYETMDVLLARNPYPNVYWSGNTLHINNLYGIATPGASGRPGAKGDNTGLPAYCLLYAKDVDTYFVYRSIGTCLAPELVPGMSDASRQYPDYALQPINIFGSRKYNSENAEEIEFVPVCIDHTDNDHGYAMFLNPSEYNENDSAEDYENADSNQLFPAFSIENGEKDNATAYYDSIYVAFTTGHIIYPMPNIPCPIIDSVVMSRKTYVSAWSDFSLRRYGDSSPTAMTLPEINPHQKFKISFLSDSIPNPRSIFNIRGKKYVCEKITATFTENGLSQLLKGEFYPLVED